MCVMLRVHPFMHLCPHSCSWRTPGVYVVLPRSVHQVNRIVRQVSLYVCRNTIEQALACLA